MYKVSKYPHGTFSWADNASTNHDAARAFYMDMFGWGKVEAPMGDDQFYTMFTLDGAFTAGFAAMQPDMQAQGIPSFWMNYVTVDDVDALAPRVEELGGKVEAGPFDVFDSGRMVVITDPTGAMLGLWQARNHIGAGIVNTVGAMCWNELITNDTDAAKTFYNALLGWEFYGDEHYIHISNRGRNNGGMIKLEHVPPCWLPYFHVADVEAGIARVQELGGSIVMGKQEAPGTGWWALAKDPADAHFYMMQLIKADAWVE